MNLYYSRIWELSETRTVIINSPHIYIGKMEFTMNFSTYFYFHTIYDNLAWKTGKIPAYQGWSFSISILGFGLEIIWGKNKYYNNRNGLK